MGDLQVKSVGLAGGMPVIESDDPIPGLEVESVYIPGPRGVAIWRPIPRPLGHVLRHLRSCRRRRLPRHNFRIRRYVCHRAVDASGNCNQRHVNAAIGGGWCTVNNEYDLVSGTRYYTMFGFVQENVSAADITAPTTNNPCLAVLILRSRR